jgi:hypothetical protein
MAIAPEQVHLHVIKILHRDSILLARNLYRRRACSQFKLYPDAKNFAMLRSLQLWWHYLHSQDALSASVRLSTTNALYCRALCLSSDPTPDRLLDKFVILIRAVKYLDTFVTINQSLECFLL